MNFKKLFLIALLALPVLGYAQQEPVLPIEINTLPTLILNKNNFKDIADQAQANPVFMQQLLQYLTNNLSALCKQEYLDISGLISLLLQHNENPAIERQIEDLCIYHITSLCHDPASHTILALFPDNVLERIALEVRHHCAQISQTPYGGHLINYLIQKNLFVLPDGLAAALYPSYEHVGAHPFVRLAQKDIISHAIKTDFETISPASLAPFIHQLIDNKKIQQLFEHQGNNQKISFASLLKLIAYAHYAQHGKDILKNHHLGPTELHLLKNFPMIHDYYHNIVGAITFMQDKKYIELSAKIAQLQKDLDQQGYYTFVHGQQWNYRIAERWFTWLYALKHNIGIDNYTFAHVKKLNIDLAQEEEQREYLIKHGRAKGEKSREMRSKLLFMNYALFANLQISGNNTPYYFLNNTNCHKKFLTINLETAFTSIDPTWQQCYEHYKPALLDLEQEHNELTQQGNLFLIAIPKDKIQDCVYCSWPKGYKKNIMIDGIGETDDIRLIMETLLHNPEKINDTDFIEFCLVMTWDMALNPASGIKFFDFNDVDADTLEAFNKKEQALFEKVKQTIVQTK